MLSEVTQCLDILSYPLSSPACENLPIPQPLKLPFRLMHTVNFCMRCFENQEFYVNHKELFASGILINRAFGSSPGVRQIAQTALICRVMLDVLNKTDGVKKAWEKVYNIATGAFGSNTFFLKEHFAKSSCMNRERNFIVTVVIYSPIPIGDLVVKIEHMAHALIELVAMMWLLSRCLLDLIDACILDRFSEFEAISGICANVVHTYNLLLRDSLLLASEIESHSRVVDSVLEYFGTQIRAKEIVPLIRKNAQTAEQLQGTISFGMKQIANTALDVGFDMVLLQTGYAHPGLVSQNRRPQGPVFTTVRPLNEYNSSPYTPHLAGFKQFSI
jgi:hypothetical protein